MKILYIHQYFKTPNEPGGTRSFWFSQYLIKEGFRVTMLTSRNKQKKLVERHTIEGIDVIYIKNSYDNSFGFIKRIWSFIRFMFISTFLAFKEKDIDLVFATSTPLTVGFPALLLKWFKGKNYIFEVRDLWPEVPIQMGIIKNSIIIHLLKYFEKKIYQNSVHIIALSPGMLEGVLKAGIKSSKLTMIPNMSKIEQFYLRPKNKYLMNKYDLSEDNFYIIHFGAMGLANGLDYILDAAKIIQNMKFYNIVFLFAGKGGQEDHLKSRVIKEKINNVKFLGAFNMRDMAEIVNIADCSIITFANIPILTTNSPNKLFDSLSAQKPVIVNSPGWTKKMVEEYNCGAYVNPENPKELSDLLIDWYSNREKLISMGINSRKLAEKVFDKSILAKQFVNIIKEYVQKYN
jgi:glycosyltransferase involved in cell wall biosynthesis